MTAENPQPIVLANGDQLTVEIAQERYYLSINNQVTLQVTQRQMDKDSTVTQFELLECVDDLIQPVNYLAYWYFNQNPQHKALDLYIAEPTTYQQALQKLQIQGLLLPQGNNTYRCEQGAFWQQTPLWLTAAHRSADFPLMMQISEGKRHPQRPPVPAGEVYKRFIPELNCYFSLATVDPEQHVDLVGKWLNNPRVDYFWQQSGPREEHLDYLQQVSADPHIQPLLGCFDGQPFAYFEAYWAKEDRIAPFYQAGDFDRGVHMLVGEEHHRGPHKVHAWLSSLAHYLFLDDPRTQMLVSEPRSDNAKMIAYQQSIGFFKQKEFDFPHKRSAMMSLHRETFFDPCILR